MNTVFNLVDPQICGFCPNNIDLKQYKIADCIISIFKKQVLISKKVIYYFCGYNDYFFHYHMLKDNFDIVVIDIPGFGFNKKYDIDNYGMNIYSDGNKFGYYDDISQIVKSLDLVFNILVGDQFNFNNIYKDHYIYGHSTGGHIVLSYISESKSTICHKFKRIILDSPLTRFYFPPIKVPVLNFNLDLNNFLYYSIKILGFLSKNIDIVAIFKGNKIDNSKYINLIDNLIKNVQNNNGNKIDLKFKSNILQSLLVGFINCVHYQTQKMINNKEKIKIETILICSKMYGSNTTDVYNYDDSLNPDFIVSDIRKIICDKNLTVHQTNTGHNVMLEPITESWENYFNLMFN